MSGAGTERSRANAAVVRCWRKLTPNLSWYPRSSKRRQHMARSYLIFGDIEGKLDVLRVECTTPRFRALALFAPPAT